MNVMVIRVWMVENAEILQVDTNVFVRKITKEPTVIKVSAFQRDIVRFQMFVIVVDFQNKPAIFGREEKHTPHKHVFDHGFRPYACVYLVNLVIFNFLKWKEKSYAITCSPKLPHSQ